MKVNIALDRRPFGSVAGPQDAAVPDFYRKIRRAGKAENLGFALPHAKFSVSWRAEGAAIPKNSRLLIF
jgi:hypothetical protein